MQNWFTQTEVEHLSITRSDHAPMLLHMDKRVIIHRKTFRFLNFWTENAAFTEVVRQNWVANENLNPFLLFKEKIRRVETTLSKCSKETYDDIFKQIVIHKDIVKFKEKLFEEVPND